MTIIVFHTISIAVLTCLVAFISWNINLDRRALRKELNEMHKHMIFVMTEIFNLKNSHDERNESNTASIDGILEAIREDYDAEAEEQDSEGA